MSTQYQDVLQAAMSLPEADRIELVDTLIASFEADKALPFDDAWLGEIQRRSAEYDAGVVEAAPWSVVKERVRQRCQRHG